jgi:hypothetical protein
MTNSNTGRNTEQITESTAKISSRMLATTFETGSGLVFNIARVAAFVP